MLAISFIPACLSIFFPFCLDLLSWPTCFLSLPPHASIGSSHHWQKIVVLALHLAESKAGWHLRDQQVKRGISFHTLKCPVAYKSFCLSELVDIQWWLRNYVPLSTHILLLIRSCCNIAQSYFYLQFVAVFPNLEEEKVFVFFSLDPNFLYNSNDN